MKKVAGCSRKPLSFWTNAAAFAAVDDAVIERRGEVHHLAHDDLSAATTGRSMILFGPMIATSGWLITGVVATPPSAPRLVIVMVEPVSSSRAPCRRAPRSPGARPPRRTPRDRALRHDARPARRARSAFASRCRCARLRAGGRRRFIVEARVDLRDVPARSRTSARIRNGSTVSLRLLARYRGIEMQRAGPRAPSCPLPRRRRSAECAASPPASARRSCAGGR